MQVGDYFIVRWDGIYPAVVRATCSSHVGVKGKVVMCTSLGKIGHTCERVCSDKVNEQDFRISKYDKSWYPLTESSVI